MKKSTFKKLSHTIYECKYHIVFCPKYRHRILKGDIAECIIRFYSALIPETIRQVNPAVFGSHSGKHPAGFYQFPEWVPDSSGIFTS